MAFFDFVKSDFQDQHKAKPKALTSVEEGKNVRIKMQAKERRSRRIDTFITNRGIEEDDTPLTPQSEGPAPKKQEVTDPRKKQMLLWKQERMKRKKLEPKKLPPFKVGVVRHAIAPFQEEIFKNPIKTHINDPHPPIQRVTRSTTRTILNGVQPSTSHLQRPPIQQKSFAPLNAKFHAPKVNIVERKNLKLKYTPRKSRREPVTIFSNLFPSSENVKCSPEMKSKRKNSGKNKEPNNKRKVSRSKTVMKDDSFSNASENEMKLHGLELARTASLPSTPGNSPQGINTPVNITNIRENSKELFGSPEPSNSNSDLVVSSPFVTFSRGKGSRQEENLCKKNFGYSAMSPEKTAQCFRLQLDGEIARLQGLCQVWKTYQDENKEILMEESQELINVAIGQTTLLMTKKFEQFRGLIVRCETRERRDGEGVVTVQDLQGFWDMVFMQVENVDVRFNRLVELKSKNWYVDETAPVVPITKKKPAGKSKPATKSSSGLKAMILAARMKSKGSAKQTLTPQQATNTFDGGFFSVISPVKNREEENELVKTSGKRVSMLKSVVGSEAKKRLSTKTPPSTAMAAILRVSCLAKNVATNNCMDNGVTEYMVAPVDLNRTPGKGILKTPGTNKKNSQNTRKSVKVLFRGDEEVENIPSTRPLTRSSISQNTNTLIELDVDTNLNGMENQQNITENKDKVEIEKPAKRPRLTRQNAEESHNVENESPSEDINMMSKSNKRNKRRKAQKKTNVVDATEEAEPNALATTLKSGSTRPTQDFLSDLQLSDSPLAEEKNFATRRHKRKSLDDRKSFNLIIFSPDKPVHNTRSTLRRISTNTPTVRL